MRRGHLEVAGHALEYAHLGPRPDRSPCLVLLHEGLGCVELWRDFPARARAATGWGVFSYSRAGYGGSSRCSLPRPLDYMRDEAERVLPEVLAAIGFRRGVVLGHSDGASIAAIFAGGVGADAIDGLVLLAPHFFTEDSGIAAIEAARVAFEEGRLRRRLARYHGENTECAFRGWNDAWLDPGFRAFDIRDCLVGIRVPVCVVQGLDDPYGTRAQADVVEARCTCPVEVKLLEGCGHAPHHDREETVLATLRAFTRDVAP